MQAMNLFRALIAVVLLLLATACGDSDERAVLSGPGLVGIDDRPGVTATAPLLTVKHSLDPNEVFIFSDQPSDGDIAFDPVQGSFVITQGPDTLLFGIDSFTRNRLEYRAFLDFPLNGSTGGPVIPLSATIEFAELSVFIDFVDFAATVPVLLDLVTYDVIDGLEPADFSSPPVTPSAFLAFDLFDSDTGQFVNINVTDLMVEAQAFGLADFQVRFVLGP